MSYKERASATMTLQRGCRAMLTMDNGASGKSAIAAIEIVKRGSRRGKPVTRKRYSRYL
jgi:hypothetical protein